VKVTKTGMMKRIKRWKDDAALNQFIKNIFQQFLPAEHT